MAAPSLGQDGGLAILDPARTALLNVLDRVFAGWGREAGGEEVSPPPVFPVADLEKFDVYVNFPHLSLVVAALLTEGEVAPRGGRFDTDRLQPARLGLPTATCFGAYLFYEGRRVAPDTVATLVNWCFRGENRFDGLRRLLSFRMREIVAIGSYEHTQDILRAHVTRIEQLCFFLSLDVATEAASDPFFQREGARARLQTLQAVKHEFVVDGLAISSVNTHRNFFGERCNITLDDGGVGGFAYTSCVAFGLERWVSVLLNRYGSAEAAIVAVERASAELQLA
ncbi:MAG: hypothetical protein ACRDRO_12285 [Pseudonocardiaceae bacterium]